MSRVFVSPRNVSTLIDIFKRFLNERHQIDNVSMYEKDITTVVNTTVRRLSKQDELRNLNTNELNKVAVSIIKNVLVKNIISTGTSSTHQQKQPPSIMTDNRQFEMMREERNSATSAPVVTKPPNLVSMKIDREMLSDDEFKSKLDDLHRDRELLMLDSDVQSAQQGLNPAGDSKHIVLVEQEPSSVMAENTPSNTAIATATSAPAPSILRYNDSIEGVDTRNQYQSVVGESNNSSDQHQTTVHTTTLYIDSRDRNDTVDSSTCHYTITFQQPIKNVTSLSLTNAYYDKNHSKSAEPYASIVIDECVQNNLSSNENNGNAFAILPLRNIFTVSNSMKHLGEKKFVPPLESLKKLTIKIQKHNGSFCSNFGEHLFRFEVTTNNPISQFDWGDYRKLTTDTVTNAFHRSQEDEEPAQDEHTETEDEEEEDEDEVEGPVASAQAEQGHEEEEEEDDDEEDDDEEEEEEEPNSHALAFRLSSVVGEEHTPLTTEQTSSSSTSSE